VPAIANLRQTGPNKLGCPGDQKTLSTQIPIRVDKKQQIDAIIRPLRRSSCILLEDSIVGNPCVHRRPGFRSTNLEPLNTFVHAARVDSGADDRRFS
jgi:hypothetical protein